LLELRQQGKTVFLNSHLLSELERVCDRVAVLVDGLVARQGTLSELTDHTVEYRIIVDGDPTPVREKLTAAGVRVEGHVLTLAGSDLGRVNATIDLLRKHGIPIESVQPQRFSLEDILVEAMASGTRADQSRDRKGADGTEMTRQPKPS